MIYKIYELVNLYYNKDIYIFMTCKSDNSKQCIILYLLY